MIGSIIGGGLSAVGSIFGGIAASKAIKKAKANIKEQKADNAAWYNRRYNEDATQRADAQRILTMTEESIKNRNKQAAGAAAVAGGSEESVAATKQANADAMANAAAQIDVAGEARKDNIEQQYRQNDIQLDNQLTQLEINKAQGIAQATQEVAKTGANIAGLF